MLLFKLPLNLWSLEEDSPEAHIGMYDRNKVSELNIKEGFIIKYEKENTPNNVKPNS